MNLSIRNENTGKTVFATFPCEEKTSNTSAISYSYPIQQTLKLSKRTVQRAIDDLLASGLLTKESRVRENGDRSSNNYYLKF